MIFPTFTLCCELLPTDPDDVCKISAKQNDPIILVCTFPSRDMASEQVIAWQFTDTLDKQNGNAVAFGAHLTEYGLQCGIAVETRYIIISFLCGHIVIR